MLRLLIFTLLIGFDAHACRCREITIEQNFDNSNFVIIAKAIKVDQTHQYPESNFTKGTVHGFQSKFQIVKVYKGENIPDTIVVEGGVGSCATEFIEGKTYLILGIQKDGTYSTNMCDHTGCVEHAPVIADIEALNKR